MGLLLRLVCLWGFLDALLLGTRPKAWGKFWKKGVLAISETPQLPKLLATVQFAICFWILDKLGDKKHKCKK